MAITNQDRVGKAMELLRAGLAPFVEREFKSQHQAQAAEAARRYFGDDRTVGKKPVVIDEWVAYARQLHDQSDLPAGGFETQFTFAQALTESAKLAGKQTMWR